MTTIRILHVLDTSLPLHSGYGFRTGAFNPIIAEGWTSPECLLMPGAG